MIDDKKLIRRALMGNQEAQKECTDKGIVLPCPFCNGEAYLIKKDGFYSVVCKYGTCIASDIKPEYIGPVAALFDWNTRPAPPVGRCVECKFYTILGHCKVHSQEPDQYGSGAYVEMLPQDFCSYFEPKEE